jgi:hypothetical protein
MVPNYTPPQWWECDLCVVTKANLWAEYEIKLSLSDLRADARKACERYEKCRPHHRGGRRGLYTRRTIVVNKHEALKRGEPFGPSRFFYVVPRELADHVPPWAGLWIISPSGGYVRKHRESKRLHRHAVQRSFITAMQTAAYHRFWHVRAGAEVQP